MTSKMNLKLASFDGGGVRGLSQLEIMNNIVHRLNWNGQSNGPKSLLPCEHFDLIGGSGTGGLIAIMFAKLRMTVEEASEEFCTIAEEVYKQIDITPKDRTQRLKQCMENLMKKRGLPVDMKLLDEAQTGGCACFVVATPRNNAATKMCLRSYPVNSHPASAITVVEAVLATCATQPAFSPVTFGLNYKKKEYIGVGLGANNPVNEVIVEANSLYGGNTTVAFLLSVGSGHPGVINLPSDSGDVDLYKTMREMMNDCTEKAREIKQKIDRSGIYYRFSVEQGMQNDHPSQAVDLGRIVTQTESYIEEHIQQLDAFAKNNNNPINVVTLGQLKSGNVRGIFPANLDTVDIDNTGSNNESAILAKLKPLDLDCGPAVGQCMQGTRQDVLTSTLVWTSDFDAPNIFWVKGHPGVGKSAISVSLTEDLQRSKRLGSCFFFQRECANALTPNTLWRVVAYDLARKYPTIRKRLLVALTANEALITTKNTELLFRELIHEPLTTCDDISDQNPPVIVIDALDECGGLDGQRSEHRANLRRTLKGWSNLPRIFKIIVTSRGEADLEDLFSTIHHVPLEIYAGTVASITSLEDIKIFFEQQFRQIVNRYQGELSADWPGQQIIQELTLKSGGLFIWVKTVIGFLNEGDPEEQLSLILAGTGAGGMATLYSWILKSAFPHPSKRVIEAFHAFVGTVILAKDPLPAASILELCSISPLTMKCIRNGLQSVMTSGDIPRFKHQSVVDFLIDPTQCPPVFLIEQSDQNRRLTLQCLQTMKKHLQFNICGIESSYYRNSDIPDLASTIEECISRHLAYSCCFWTDHLTETRFGVEIYEMICDFMKSRFLFWMEILSLIKCVNRGSSMMQLLINWLQCAGRDDKLAVDMKKFISMFGRVISQSAPHTYLSALPFSPHKSLVSRQYGKGYPGVFHVRSGGHSDWPAMQNILIGHTSLVLSVAFSPDGKCIVSGSSDNTIRIWDAETGEVVVGPFQGHTSSVNSVAFSLDGKRIVSGSSDNTIRVWDAQTGKAVTEPFKGYSNQVTFVSFSPDGKRIISGSDNSTIQVWDTETGEIVARHFGSDSYYNRPFKCFSNGKHVAYISNGHTIRVWDSETGEIVVESFQGHTNSVDFIAFSPVEKRIVSGDYDGTILVWDSETGEVAAGPFKVHAKTTRSAAFSPDGRRIVSGEHDGHEGHDGTIQIWDAETGEVVAGPFKGHTSYVNSVAFSPDGKRVVSGSFDKTIRLWDAETSEVIAGPSKDQTGHLTAVAFSPDGKSVVFGSSDHKMRVWDAETGEMVLGPFKSDTGASASIAFSPDGKCIISGSHSNIIQVWNMVTGKVVITLFEDDRNRVDSVAFSPDGKRVVSASNGFENYLLYMVIRVWDAETGEVVAGPFEGHIKNASCTALSSDGSHVISADYGGEIRVQDVETGEIVSGPFGSDRYRWPWNSTIALSRDGKRAVYNSTNKGTLVWDVETGEVVAGPFEGHVDSVTSVAFSPDGQYVVSGSRDRMTRIWDTKVSTSGFPHFTDSSIMRDGWILGLNSELLFWVPPELRAGLYRPGNTAIIGPLIRTKLDFKRFAHGERWSHCKDSLPK